MFKINSIIRRTYVRRRFIDKTRVFVKGGRGGNGCLSHEVISPTRKKPDGGSGGAGGNIYVIADRSKVDLSFSTAHFNAGNGKHGSSEKIKGKKGSDMYITVPCGTTIIDADELDERNELLEYDEEYNNNINNEDEAYKLDDESYSSSSDNAVAEELEGGYDPDAELPPINVIDLDRHGDKVCVAYGGRPGIGNASLPRFLGSVKGGSRVSARSLPKSKQNGELGEERSVELELKIIADIGLVGYPNAGKSSLLKALSNAQPEIAAYPFTTLFPNIGVVEYSDTVRLKVADIPGLIEGASENRGLGHDFLRHLERTKVLLFVLSCETVDDDDDTATEKKGEERGRDAPARTLRKLWHELEQYNPELLDKPMVVLLNKCDLVHVEAVEGVEGEVKTTPNTLPTNQDQKNNSLQDNKKIKEEEEEEDDDDNEENEEDAAADTDASVSPVLSFAEVSTSALEEALAHLREAIDEMERKRRVQRREGREREQVLQNMKYSSRSSSSSSSINSGRNHDLLEEIDDETEQDHRIALICGSAADGLGLSLVAGSIRKATEMLYKQKVNKYKKRR